MSFISDSVADFCRLLPSFRKIGLRVFALEDGGRLAYAEAEVVGRFDISVGVRRFKSLREVDSHTLRYESYTRSPHEGVCSAFYFCSLPWVHPTLLCGSSWHVDWASSYLRDALQKSGEAVVACLIAPRA
jgi:hypothetical protein